MIFEQLADPSAFSKPSARAILGRSPTPDNHVRLSDPPYAIHNGQATLSNNTIATNVTHHGGYTELDMHNLWGTMEARATRQSVLEIRKGERPFMISRSTFAGAGKFAGHWVSDAVFEL
jgi:alpha-glucosidase